MSYDSPAAWWTGNEGDLIVGQGWQHPGASSDSQLRWSAPFSGILSITGSVVDSDASCGDGVIASILVNGSQSWSASIANGQSTSHNLSLAIAAGDFVQFRVNRNGNHYCDSTSWNPTLHY